MKRANVYQIAGALALALALPITATAQESTAQEASVDVKPKLGVIFEPSLSLSETYSDNLFATAKDTKSGFVTTIKPDLGLQWILGLGAAAGIPFEGFTFGAKADIASSGDFSDLNRVDWNLFGRGHFVFRDRLTLDVGDTYTPGHLTLLESVTGKPDRFTTNVATAGLKFDFREIWQLRFAYTNTILDYHDSENRSRVEDLINAGVYVKLLSRTKTFLAYDYTRLSYDDPASTMDGNRQGVNAGVEWEISEFTKGTVGVGYRTLHFEDPAQNGLSTWGASIDMRHELNEGASLALRLERTINEGKYEGMRYILTTGFSAILNYPFADRFTGKVGAGFFLDDYSDPIDEDPADRKDSTLRVDIGVGYAFRTWLGIDLNYSFVDRRSNIDFPFTDLDKYSAKINEITLQATVRLPK